MLEWDGEEKKRKRAKLGRRRTEGGFRTVGGGPRRNFFLGAVIGCGGESQWTPSCLADSSDAPLQLLPGPRGVFGGGTGGANAYRASRANFQGVPEPRQHIYLPGTRPLSRLLCLGQLWTGRRANLASGGPLRGRGHSQAGILGLM